MSNAANSVAAAPPTLPVAPAITAVGGLVSVEYAIANFCRVIHFKCIFSEVCSVMYANFRLVHIADLAR